MPSTGELPCQPWTTSLDWYMREKKKTRLCLIEAMMLSTPLQQPSLSSK